MINIDETFLDIKKFLQKAIYTINNESSFTFVDTKLVEKRKLDDIWCCVEASFPESYRKIIKLNKTEILKDGEVHKFHSIKTYFELRRLVLNKFVLSSSFYLIQYTRVPSLSQKFLNEVKKDLEDIIQNF